MLQFIILFAILCIIAVVLLVKYGPLEYTSNARKVWKTYSLWLGIVGTALTGFLASFPEYAVDIWNAMPPEFKTWIPERYMPAVGSIFFVLSLISKFIAQKKLEKTND